MTPAKLMESQRREAPPGTSLKTIVVATDFSDSATAALDWATDLAKAHGAQIVLVHAVDTELPALAEAMGPIGTYVRQKLETGFRSLAARHVPAQTEYDVGRPWSVIPEVARKARADLIVVGAHGRSMFRVLGTVADRLIRTTSIPVVVHRARAEAAPGVRTVLAATDFSEEATLAIEAAVRLLGGPTGPARLVLLHAVPLLIHYVDLNVSASLPAYWDEAEADAAQRLETLADALRSDRLQVDVKTFRGHPSESILQEAEAMEVDLIAMGTVGRSGPNRFFMGSVAERVLHHARCPVLTVRKAESEKPRSPP